MELKWLGGKSGCTWNIIFSALLVINNSHIVFFSRKFWRNIKFSDGDIKFNFNGNKNQWNEVFGLNVIIYFF